MKRKGFTLIELLTVIAILAVILLIAAPVILNTLEKARQNTFKNQVLLYVEGLKQKVTLSALGEESLILPEKGSFITVDISTIQLDSDKGYTGSIKITNENGKYKYEVINVIGDGYQANGPTSNITVTKVGDKTETPKPTYTAYSIGDQVTLKDNSVWYVIEDSNSSSNTVTLFASSNIKNDASGWTTVQSEYSEYNIAFDEANARTTEKNSYCTNPENGCNIYASQNGTVTSGEHSGTVTEDSTIKKFIDNKVKPYINNNLTSSGGTSINSIRLITIDEICNVINASDSSNNCTLNTLKFNSNGGKYFKDVFTNVPSWIYSTTYWTMTPYSVCSYRMHHVGNLGALSDSHNASGGSSIGARPVIVTNKSNIK